MKNISNPVEIRPSAAELRGAIRIPPPPPGSSKALQQEHHVLQARADALEADRGLAAQHRADLDVESAEFFCDGGDFARGDALHVHFGDSQFQGPFAAFE